MNIEDLTSNITKKQILFLVLFLCLVIAYLLFKPTPSIKVNTNGFSNKDLLIVSLQVDGTLVFTARNGETTTIDPERDLKTQGSTILLNSIGTAIFGNTNNDNSDNKQLGLMDKIISPAMASRHNLPGHNYVNVQWDSGGARKCSRYDVTGFPNVPPIFVGACI